MAEAEPSKDTAGPAERALASLKPFAHIAREDYNMETGEKGGADVLSWEIYSTWTLLLCLHHSEAEAERCIAGGWKPQRWRTEAQALRHIFLHSRSLRALSAVLRWLRWAHRWCPAEVRSVAHHGVSAAHEEEGNIVDGRANFERTRLILRLQSSLPTPLQAGPVLHPDGPLQQSNRFEKADLEDEERLLRRVFCALRRGNLRGAFAACAECGQAWRTALLQGMLPFADRPRKADNLAGYDAMEDDGEDELAALREVYTDWTEIGALDQPGACNGNPWRRVWKEQCWDTAQRHLRQPGSAMTLHELAVYGFCAGHKDALLPACSGNWSDLCWGELHCLKEGLVERLLEIGRDDCCKAGVFLGEGDGGFGDPLETAESRAERNNKLSGALRGTAADGLDSAVVAEVHRVLKRLDAEEIHDTAVPTRTTVTAAFDTLRATLVRAAWEPECGEQALAMLREWLDQGIGGTSCPFALKQFASHFAMWQKEVLQERFAAPCSISLGGQVVRGLQSAAQSAELGSVNVDDIVRKLIDDLVMAASGAWRMQCLEGQAVELIAEHLSALSTEARLEAFTSLLLRLGPAGSAGTEAAAALVAPLRQQVFKHCLWIFWGRFPEDSFALITMLVRRALRLDDACEEEEELPELGCTGVRSSANANDISVAILCTILFWVIVRDKAEAGSGVQEAFSGLERIGKSPFSDDARPQGGDEFARIALEAVALPLLVDSLLTLAVKEPERALALMKLECLRQSRLWQDAFNSNCSGAILLKDLEWLLILNDKHSEWVDAHSEQEAQWKVTKPRLAAGIFANSCDFARISGWKDPDREEWLAKAEQQCSMSRDVVLDWAHPRIASDAPLMSPPRGFHTSIVEGQRRRLCSAVTCRVLLVLLSVFEGAADFEGAMNLGVTLANSPWMLQVVTPYQARSFLHRLAVLPTRLDAGQVAALEH